MMSEYAVWPDGTWCELSELEEMLNNGWSDDFCITDQIPES
jgi:hypothetical protein